MDHDVTCASVVANTSTYSSLDLSNAEGSCSCFLFHLHDAGSCAYGALLYISQFGAFDPQQFLQLITLLVAIIAWRKPHGTGGLTSVRMHKAGEHGGAKILAALATVAALGWVSRASFLLSNSSVARKANIPLAALSTCATIVVVLQLHAEWFALHDATGGHAALLSLPLTRTASALDKQWWRDFAGTRSHLAVAALRFVGGLSALYPILAIVIATQSAPSAAALDAAKVAFMWVWAWALIACIDFLACSALARHRGLAGGDPIKLAPERQIDQTTMLTVVTICLGLTCGINLAVLGGSFCPYIESNVDPRGDPHEQPFPDMVSAWGHRQHSSVDTSSLSPSLSLAITLSLALSRSRSLLSVLYLCKF